MQTGVAGVFMNASGALRAPWRIAAFGVALAATAIGVTGIAYAIAMETPVVAWSRVARVPLDQVAIMLSVLIATWLVGRMVHGGDHRVWARVGLGRAAWRPRRLVEGTALGVAVIAVPSLVMLAFGVLRLEASTATDSAAVAAWAAFALMLPAAVTEEVLTRGYLFAACRDGMGTGGAIVVSSACFGLAHLANPGPTVASVLAVTGAGVFLAVVRVATDSLAAACAAHLAFNLTQAVALHAPVSGLALQTPGYRLVPAGPDWLTGGAWGPEGGAGVVAALALASFLLWTRRTHVDERATGISTNGGTQTDTNAGGDAARTHGAR